MSEPNHSHPDYIRIWQWLMGLLIISIVGPMLGITWILLLTAFGVAVVKALMVSAWFMHLNTEKRFIWYLLTVSIVFLAILFFFIAPDILRHEGTNWKNTRKVPEFKLPEPKSAPAAAPKKDSAFE